MSKWDAAIEKLVQAGNDEELDQDVLYVTFRDSFMTIPESKIDLRASLETSRVSAFIRYTLNGIQMTKADDARMFAPVNSLLGNT